MSSPGSPGSPAGSPARGMVRLPHVDGSSPESGKRVLEQAVQPPRIGDETPQHGAKSPSVCGRSSLDGVRSLQTVSDLPHHGARPHQNGSKLAEDDTQSPDDEPKEIWLFSVKPPQEMKKPSEDGIQSPHSVSELPQHGARSPHSCGGSSKHGDRSTPSGCASPKHGARSPNTGSRSLEHGIQSHSGGELQQHAIRSPSRVIQSGAEGSLGDREDRAGAAALHQLSGSPTLQHSGEGTPKHNLIERPEKFSTDIPDEFEVSDSAIRQGSLSQLQRAWRWTTAQKVVLKYPSQAAWVVKGQKRLRDVFGREAAALQTIRCKNVVECYDFIGDELLLVLEACNHDLEHQIECSDVKPQARELMRGILTGLKSIHGADITHNDLHPRNIMVSDGVPKIGDLGVSRRCGQKWPQETTGTIRPPRRGRVADTQADCWAAGLVMCCLLTNSMFMDEDISAMESIKEGDLDLVMDSNPQFRGISASPKDLVRKLLCLDPLSRISAAEALQHPWFAEGGDDSLVSSKKRTRSECGEQDDDEPADQGKKLKILRTHEEQGDVEDAEAGLALKEDGDSARPQTSKKRGRSGDDEARTSSGSASSARRRDAKRRATRRAIMESWMEDSGSLEGSDIDDGFEATSSRKKRSKI